MCKAKTCTRSVRKYAVGQSSTLKIGGQVDSRNECIGKYTLLVLESYVCRDLKSSFICIFFYIHVPLNLLQTVLCLHVLELHNKSLIVSHLTT